MKLKTGAQRVGLAVVVGGAVAGSVVYTMQRREGMRESAPSVESKAHVETAPEQPRSELAAATVSIQEMVLTTGAIRDATDALVRAQERWPVAGNMGQSTAKLMTYSELAAWGGWDSDSDVPVWVVAALADADDVGHGYGSETEVRRDPAGWWFQFSACNGEPEMSGGLSEDGFGRLAQHPARPVDYEPCDPRPTELAETGPAPWEVATLTPSAVVTPAP